MTEVRRFWRKTVSKPDCIPPLQKQDHRPPLFSFWKSSFVSVVSFFYSFVLTKNPTLIEITPSNQRGNRSSVTQNNKTGECFDAMTPR